MSGFLSNFSRIVDYKYPPNRSDDCEALPGADCLKIQGLSEWEERQEEYVIVSDFRVDLSLLFMVLPSLSYMALWLLLNVMSEASKLYDLSSHIECIKLVEINFIIN